MSFCLGSRRWCVEALADGGDALAELTERVALAPRACEDFHEQTVRGLERRSEIHPRDAPEVVERAMEVVRSGLEILVGPEAIDELFAMQGLAGRQRQGGEHVDRTALAPGSRRNGAAFGLDCEPAQQKDASGGGGSRRGGYDGGLSPIRACYELSIAREHNPRKPFGAEGR
jgi:hypothetical protein